MLRNKDKYNTEFSTTFKTLVNSKQIHFNIPFVQSRLLIKNNTNYFQEKETVNKIVTPIEKEPEEEDVVTTTITKKHKKRSPTKSTTPNETEVSLCYQWRFTPSQDINNYYSKSTPTSIVQVLHWNTKESVTAQKTNDFHHFMHTSLVVEMAFTQMWLLEIGQEYKNNIEYLHKPISQFLQASNKIWYFLLKKGGQESGLCSLPRIQQRLYSLILIKS